jgi:predicted ATP-dependent protease
LNHPSRLPAESLRWRIDERRLPFRSTVEVDPAEGIVGQPVALEAMRFGVECDAPGQNVYVRGVTGTGRMTMVHSLLRELKPKARRRLDRCYVHNFGQPDRPRLITLPAGYGPRFRRMMKEVSDFIQDRLGEALNSTHLKDTREAIRDRTQQELARITEPLEKELHANGLALVQLQAGPLAQAAIFPVINGEPIPPEKLKQMTMAGQFDEAEFSRLEESIKQYSKKMAEVSSQANQAYVDGLNRLRNLAETETRSILNNLTQGILAEMDNEAVATFIGEVIDDVIENRLQGDPSEHQPEPQVIYGVNVICSHEDANESPVIIENSPTMMNLLGTVDSEIVAGGQAVFNYRGIRAGALVHADGGFLILDAHDVLTEPGAWRMLMRALRTGCVEIVPAELSWPLVTHSLKPEPIGISVRVILIGSGGLYYLLDSIDQDFADLFKVLADFDSQIERSDVGISQYAGVLARMSRNEGLPHFSAGGVAALVEHGARIAARKGKITARFGRLADVVREASFIAGKDGSELVERRHVEETVRRTKYRASLPTQRFLELIADGTIRVATEGSVVGQINGLAVMHAGPLSYGFPARVTATIGAGRAGVINIEGAAEMSGAIHTKGFHILGGLLRQLLHTDHPLAFSASIAFEQSYGGIDGDSASGAEICCLLSALTGVPIRQGIAMTGAIDQLGHIQAIGGVNEKIEGFFDACKAIGLTGGQGVLIPASNAGDLMLRPDVVEACREGNFHIFAVADVNEALEVLTGMPAGTADASGHYAEGTLLRLAQERAGEFWRKTLAQPAHASADRDEDPA